MNKATQIATSQSTAIPFSTRTNRAWQVRGRWLSPDPEKPVGSQPVLLPVVLGELTSDLKLDEGSIPFHDWSTLRNNQEV